MKIRKLWWLGATGGAAALIGVLWAIPAMAAPSTQELSPEPDTYTAMHEACAAGDFQGMTEGMDALTGEDWQAMGEHMDDGHHGTMEEQMGDGHHGTMGEQMDDGHHGTEGSGMMGTGGMLSGWSGQDMMWW